MDTTRPLPLLGGLTPRQFMKQHWQKKPLLVRSAVAGFAGVMPRAELFAMAARDDVESRLVTRDARGWRTRQGPIGRRSLPPLSQPAWTLLVQGIDLQHDGAHALLNQFRFIPDARLDDLMISHATDGGGVGPHFDSYDVFLLQAHGRRRWRYGRQSDLTLVEGLPLKILAHFEPEEDVVLEPGDMLYLPPRYAHDGIAMGECQTCSIGFRSPAAGELAREMLQRLADDAAESSNGLYLDPAQPATATPGAIPPALHRFTSRSLTAALKDPHAVGRALGEYLSEPKAQVWFEPNASSRPMQAVSLDRRSRMLYDARHVFLNGESWRASGRDARLMQKLADERRLGRADIAKASGGAAALLESWRQAGWLHDEGVIHDDT